MNDTNSDNTTGILADNGVAYVRGRVSGSFEVYDVYLVKGDVKVATVSEFADAQRLAHNLVANSYV